MEKIIGVNRKAIANFELEDSREAGIVLLGSEVKAIREGRASFKSAHCEIIDGEIWLHGLHIGRYKTTSTFAPKEDRPRKLLLNKREISRLIGQVSQKGFALVPTKIYFKNSWVKVSISLGRGKRLIDKREEIKKRETRREISRLLKGQQS